MEEVGAHVICIEVSILRFFVVVESNICDNSKAAMKCLESMYILRQPPIDTNVVDVLDF